MILVFVHGFLGSDESFKSFPLHLITELEAKNLTASYLVYEYSTAGSNRQRVHELVFYLIEKAREKKKANCDNSTLDGWIIGG